MYVGDYSDDAVRYLYPWAHVNFLLVIGMAYYIGEI